MSSEAGVGRDRHFSRHPHQLEHARVEGVYAADVLKGLVAQFVRGTGGGAGLHAAVPVDECISEHAAFFWGTAERSGGFVDFFNG